MNRTMIVICDTKGNVQIGTPNFETEADALIWMGKYMPSGKYKLCEIDAVKKCSLLSLL